MKKIYTTLTQTIKGISAIAVGLLTVMKIGFRKPVTLEYPEKKRLLNDRFRGKLQLKRDENGVLACTGCELCVKACPCKGTLQIEKEKDENGKTRVKSFNIDIGQCIFCGNCVNVCPKKNIFMTQEFELATENKNDLIMKSGRRKECGE